MDDTKQIKQCNSCSATDKELLRCTRCKAIYYCGVQCQKKDWPSHKLKCIKAPNVSSQVAAPAVVNKIQPDNQEDASLDGLSEFDKIQHIGTGNFSTIFKGTSKKDGKIYAIKQAEKAKLTRLRKQADLFMQKHCLSKLKDCQYVVRLWRTFQDQLHLFLLMDCPQNGELWDHSKHFGVLSESLFKYFAAHLIKAIHTIHQKYEIVHRDLKPQNILLNQNHQLKLIDFGTAKDLSRPDIKGAGNGLKGRKPFEHYVGTPNYMAPQCIHNKASQKISDVYSLSGILYFLKVGSPPFAGGSQYMIFKKSLQTDLFLCPQLFSDKLMDLLKKMNIKDMNERISLTQVMKHQYFEQIDFQNMPTYANALELITPFELYLQKLCHYLTEQYSSLHKEPQQNRQKIYRQIILPYIDKSFEEAPEEIKDQLKQRYPVLKIQLQIMINLREDNNIGFTELYKEAFNIIDPVIVRQENEEQQPERGEEVAQQKPVIDLSKQSEQINEIVKVNNTTEQPESNCIQQI